MAASTCCSAPTRSARSICARRHRERLTITLAPVGPQAPPALRSARLGGGRCAARGSLLWTTGTSCAGVNPSTMSPNTCPPCLQPLHNAGEGGQRRGFRCSAGVSLYRHSVDPHRPGDVLDLLLAQILEEEGQPVADVVMNRIGDEHPAGIGERLDPRGDVDAVAEVIALDDDV